MPRPTQVRPVLLVAWLLIWLLTTGCAGPLRPNGHAAPERTILVFAASSLTDALTDAAARFENAHPGAEIVLNFAGSQQLAQQLAQGAPADLFASADRQQLEVAVDAGRVHAADIAPLAANQLIIVTPADNPAGIQTPADLARPGVKLVVAAAQVPAGRYALAALEQAEALPAADGYGPGFAARVDGNVVSYEQNVRAVLSKVRLGEADAGIVYSSDVAAAAENAPDGIRTIPLPDAMAVNALYFVAPIADGADPDGADEFLAFLLRGAGQADLESNGFGPAADALQK